PLPRSSHFGVTVGGTVAEEVERPDIEARLDERIAPGNAVEAVPNRQRRGKRRAMNIEDGPASSPGIGARWQVAEKEPQPGMVAGDPVMLLARVEILDDVRHTAPPR